MHCEWIEGQFAVSTDPTRLDVEAIHAFLSHESYWAQGRPLAVVQRSIAHSLCFGLFDGRRQVGFARVITDRAVYAYLCDVFVLASHRGRGLGKWLLRCILAHPDLTGLRRFQLITDDAHGVYDQVGFVPLANPERHMELVNSDPPRKTI